MSWLLNVEEILNQADINNQYMFDITLILTLIGILFILIITFIILLTFVWSRANQKLEEQITTYMKNKFQSEKSLLELTATLRK